MLGRYKVRPLITTKRCLYRHIKTDQGVLVCAVSTRRPVYSDLPATPYLLPVHHVTTVESVDQRSIVRTGERQGSLLLAVWGVTGC